MKKFVALVLLLSVMFINCGGDDYYNIATFHAKQGNYKQAIEFFSKAIEKNPNDAEAYFNRAHCLQTLGGKEEQIISDYTKSLSFNPNDSEVYMNRGVAKVAIGDISDAIEDYLKSIELNSNYPLVYENLGDAYKLQFDIENACESWGKALVLGNEEVERKIILYCK